ncbi:hypothetical protein Hanom_Chr07g00667291 [Helianthus anomalus]
MLHVSTTLDLKRFRSSATDNEDELSSDVLPTISPMTRFNSTDLSIFQSPIGIGSSDKH